MVLRFHLMKRENVSCMQPMLAITLGLRLAFSEDVSKQAIIVPRVITKLSVNLGIRPTTNLIELNKALTF